MVVLTLGLVFQQLVWALTDTRSKKEKLKYYFSAQGFLTGLFGGLFILLNLFSGWYFPLPESQFADIGVLLDWFLFIGGIGLSIWAKLAMRRSWGPPSQHNFTRQDRLVTSGPFKYTRNPIYVGITMFLLGYGFLLQSYFTFLALIPMWYFYRSAEKEEKLLEKHFGKEYLKYKEKVPRFI